MLEDACCLPLLFAVYSGYGAVVKDWFTGKHRAQHPEYMAPQGRAGNNTGLLSMGTLTLGPKPWEGRLLATAALLGSRTPGGGWSHPYNSDNRPLSEAVIAEVAEYVRE